MRYEKKAPYFIMFKIFIICSLFFVHYAHAEGESVKTFTLNESIQMALENNSSIRAKEEKIQAALYSKDKAKADFLPKVSTT